MGLHHSLQLETLLQAVVNPMDNTSSSIKQLNLFRGVRLGDVRRAHLGLLLWGLKPIPCQQHMSGQQQGLTHACRQRWTNRSAAAYSSKPQPGNASILMGSSSSSSSSSSSHLLSLLSGKARLLISWSYSSNSTPSSIPSSIPSGIPNGPHTSTPSSSQPWV